jgi:hypothetical protein
MSVPVSLDGLRQEVAQFGSAPYVVTVGDDGAPHAVSVSAGWNGDRLASPVGARTAANAAARSHVTLLWPPHEPGGYSLIVDGAAEVDGGQLLVAPARAVLHRPAAPGFEPASPSCGSDCKPILR